MNVSARRLWVLALLILSMRKVRLTMVRVRGASMMPTLCDGDRVLAVRLGEWRFLRPPLGAVVVFPSPFPRLPGQAGEPDLLIKRVGHVRRHVGGDGAGVSRCLFLYGDARESSSSAQFGLVPFKDVLGVALLRLTDAGVSAVPRRHCAIVAAESFDDLSSTEGPLSAHHALSQPNSRR